MNQTYRVDIAPLLETLGETIEVSDDLALETFEVGSEVFKPTGPAHFDLNVTNTGTAIIAMGSVSLPALATCARCLCEFPTEISGEVDGFYIHRGAEEGLPEEQEVEYIDADNRVDLLPAIMGALVLEAPFAPLHDENCAGICVQCGADLNEGPCGCEAQADQSHPFAGLRDLLESEDGHADE
jgi:uncharacterized protein